MDLRNHSPETSAVRSQTAESASAKETASIVRIDPQASAALASAINSAKQGVNLEGAAGSTEPQETTPDAMPLAGARKGYSNTYLSRAAMGLVLIGSCWVASYAGTLASRDSIQQFGTDAARSEVALGRINGEIEALKSELTAFREAVNAASAAERRQSAKLGEKIDGFGQALRSADATRNSDAKFAALDARLGKMEGQADRAGDRPRLHRFGGSDSGRSACSASGAGANACGQACQERTRGRLGGAGSL
jgi:hypothetical protein